MPAETDLHNALYQNCTFLFHHYATKKAQGKNTPLELEVWRERLLDYVIELGANGNIYMIQPGPTEDPALFDAPIST